MIPDAFMSGFSAELLKLAVGEAYPETPDPNYPWRADTEARGIKKTQALPSRVPTGHLGAVGGLSKSDGVDDGYLKGQEQTGGVAE